MIVKCNKINCLWNDKSDKIEGKCTRDEILIQPSKIFGEASAICRCFSQEKIRGHMDWSRFPIGGSIDDAYSDKLAHDKNVKKF